MVPTPDDTIIALRPWIAQQERPAWAPRTSPNDDDPTGSKFSGRPVLLADEEWPICRCCNQPLELLLQLDLSALPAELTPRFGAGILQLFYCVRPNDCEPGWEPFSNQCSLCRIIVPTDSRPAPKVHNCFTPKAIVGWDRFVDYPNPIEHGRLGIVVDYHFNDVPYQPTEMKCPELNLHVVGIEHVNALDQIVTSADSDKLGGWPNWIQGVEYPSCPECGVEMTFVMQIDSEDNVPYMFGDCGMGYITQCPRHKHIVAFGWACC